MVETGEEFDFIVAGAGSAGCCVAARLSESGKYRVLLLEAGPEDKSPWIHMPMGYAKLFANPQLNWMYESEPEPELGGRTMYQPRGKVLGGTSSINGMVYMRGNPADYNEWRQRGCTGWDWDSVLPYFKKAENQERGPSETHGVGGPLNVCDHPVRWELADHWITAAVEAGMAPNSDFNNGNQDGAGHFQNTMHKARRWSTAAAYIRPARSRPNLTVATEALATRVLFDGARAVGIAYRQAGVDKEARARGEVIVCGGVYNSPQLLQLSGVGPGDLLQQHGIPVVCESADVGNQLQDHFYVRLAYRCARPITLNEVGNSLWRRAVAGVQYGLFRSGPLASNGICAGGFARSDPRLDRPDIQLNFSTWSFSHRDAKGVYPHPFPGFSVSAVHLRPDARGSVLIKSPDPTTPPLIRFNFLKTQSDLQALTAGMRLARKITEQPALAPLVVAELLPGAAVTTDAEFEAAIRTHAQSNLHPVGTCRMGADPASVVDPRLRVNGVGHLRVVDASVMPAVPAGNTNAPTIMIAEKACDMILEDARAAA
ncbi:MAG TPA: choline dehydrogenase [Stellaceae bacterium]|nr:choline dehydrogenase [Stellaceae bacterium]